MKVLVVGAGLFGSVCARELALRGHQVLVIEKREHIAGNIYSEAVENINVHKYGAHIFHTDNKKIWEYVQKFSNFNRYTNEVVANYKGRLYNLPFNMNTFYQMWGVTKPQEAQEEIKRQRAILHGKVPTNLEEQAISLVGTDIYEKLVKEYTAKQWGRAPKDLPAFIIRRLPVRFTFDNNYFNDPYQGIPIGGYTKLVSNILNVSGIEVKLNTDFFDRRDEYLKDFDKIIYTGMIDQFFDYRFGELEYRSLRFEQETLDIENYQGNAVINYTDGETPYTRIIEHKFFEFGVGNPDKTVITREYPQQWHRGIEPYYPVNDRANEHLSKKYRQFASQNYSQVIFGGRLGMYRYYNMDQVIFAAFQALSNSFNIPLADLLP